MRLSDEPADAHLGVPSAVASINQPCPELSNSGLL
jgi:hypothetical protein